MRENFLKKFITFFQPLTSIQFYKFSFVIRRKKIIVENKTKQGNVKNAGMQRPHICWKI